MAVAARNDICIGHASTCSTLARSQTLDQGSVAPSNCPILARAALFEENSECKTCKVDIDVSFGVGTRENGTEREESAQLGLFEEH